MITNRLKQIVRFVALICLGSLVFAGFAFAQETTGGIQGTVKDPQGAVVSGATVEVTSPALIGKKSLVTDQSGYYRFTNLPPGTYTVTTSASGFGVAKNDGIKLEVGALPTINVKLTLGQATETVEVSSESPAVDVTQSKVQTNVTKEILDGVPKGRSFQSLIQFAPGSRSEPLQSGYQIDGASNSENSYLVEGQETAGVVHGTSNVNVPTEFIQEVQVKTSGFEAEFGGALGGVVNVIQKHGSNAWHGSIFSYYSGDMFNAGPNVQERKDPTTVYDSVSRTDQTTQYVMPKKDQYKSVEPGFELGGPIVRDRIWAYGSFIPQINTFDRTVNMAASSGFAGPVTFHQSSQVYNAFGRLDALATQKIRVFGSWQYGYSRGNGQTASGGSVLPSPDFVGGQINNSATSPLATFSDSQGFVAPNVLYNTGVDWTLTPSLVATTRYGYFFQDAQDRGLPVGVRHQYSAGTTAATTALDGSTLGTQSGGAFVHNSGFSDIGSNFSQIFDKTSRTSFTQDVSYFKKGFLGTHNFKAGYGLNRLWNNVNDGYNTARVRLLFGQKYSVLPSDQGNCATIRATNTTTYGQPGSPDNSSCRGNWGYYMLREFGTFGQESSFNHSIYFQDAWTLGGMLSGLTINAGLRMDKETLPSYNDQPGFQGISFGFGQKLAPRIGGAYDLFHNGKVKLFASYGRFFDIMKYNLPQGSFGGQYWHDCVYTLDTPDYTTIQPARLNGSGHFCPPTGVGNGTNPGRFIENIDFRIPSNDPSNNLIDPNLQPMMQHESVVGVDWAITPKWSLETRYSRKRLDRTIEDAGSITPAGEQYYIVNPGMGVDVQPIPATDCTACPVQPKAKRNYDGFEVRLTRNASERWFGTLSYTHSRLFGNYTGLTATDISDGGPLGGRNDGNSDRAFDEPFMQFNSHGGVMDGPLPTDRPNTFKAFGFYRVKWFGMETLLGVSQLAYQGTPLTSYLSFEGTPVFPEGRGNFSNVTRNAATGDLVLNGVTQNMRTPVFTQTDLNFVHNLHVSKTNEALVVGLEANISNVLNQHAALLYDSAISNDDTSLPGAPATSLSGVNYHAYLTGYDYIGAYNNAGNVFNSAYGKPYYFQGGRTMRFKVKFVF